jgi:hypothetical protein
MVASPGHMLSGPQAKCYCRQIPAHELESWKRVFLETGTRGLKTRAEPEERDLTLARAKIGELMMRLELAEHLIEKRGFADEWRRRSG